VPPDLVDVSVEKVAIAAVMAGCLPEYLRWVLAAVEAACNDEFNMHGVLATTMPVGPVIVCSGPGTRAIGMNSGINALGQGNRANSTIGRALQLVVRNVGGGRPARSTGPPTATRASCRSASPRPPTSRSARSPRPAAPRASMHSPCSPARARAVWSTSCRANPRASRSLAANLRAMHHPKLVMAFDAILVLGPEHARVFRDGGWDRARLLDELHARLQIPGGELVRGAGGIAEGIPSRSPTTPPEVRPRRSDARVRRWRGRPVLGHRSPGG
jgi:hypothetical protein